MKCEVVEIRWHDMSPIFSTDFHSAVPVQHKKVVHPFMKTAGGVDDAAAQAAAQDEHDQQAGEDKMWRLATCGGDKFVRLWLVHPRPPPAAAPLTLPLASSSKLSAPAPVKPVESGPTVEYLATLKQHTGIVNVVRFCPVGDLIASAGDDGNVLFWIPGESASGSFGEAPEDQQYEREKWRVRNMCRTHSGQEIYDLTFSPDGSRILTGSIDHTANIYDVQTGQLIHTIAEHTNYVQGVSWDPWNRFIATQSSDRSMHIYSINDGPSGLQVHAVGKNSRMEVQHTPGGSWHPPTPAPTPSSSAHEKGKHAEEVFARPQLHARSHSRASDSGASEASSSRPPPQGDNTVNASGFEEVIIIDDEEETTAMKPPAAPRPLSRRSSASSSHPSGSALHPSPSVAPQHLRSPSPAPLPAIKVPLSPTMAPSSGGPGGKIESLKLYTDANSTPFFRRLSWSTDGSLLLTPAGLFEDPYAGIGVAATTTGGEKEKADGPASKKQRKNPTPVSSKDEELATTTGKSGGKPTVYIYSRSNVARPPVAHLPGHKTTSIAIRFCPVLWDLRKLKGDGEEQEREPVNVELRKEGVEVKLPSGEDATAEGASGKPRSLFELPYRMVYAVATLDTVFLYDTQQAAPLALFGNLHYAPFTDLSWTPDGQTLILSAQDGYCSIIAFDPFELGTPYKTALKDLPPPPSPFSSFPTTAPAPAATLPALFKKSEPVASTSAAAVGTDKKREGEEVKEGEQPAKKAKKRATLISHGVSGAGA